MKKVNRYEITLVKEGTCEYEAAGSPEAAMAIAKSINISSKAEEEFWMICLDNKNVPIGLHMISRGSLNSTIVHPREVFKRALINNAASIIVMHNHPSGNPAPSQEDIDITRRLDDAGKIIGIRCLDHIIIGDGGACVSLKEKCLF